MATTPPNGQRKGGGQWAGVSLYATRSLLGKKLGCFDNLEKLDLDYNSSELRIQNQITEYKASVIKILEGHLLLSPSPSPINQGKSSN